MALQREELRSDIDKISGLPRILTPVGIQCFDWQGGSLTPRRISASCDHGEILSREENTVLLFEGPGAHLEMILLKYINQIAGMK